MSTATQARVRPSILDLWKQWQDSDIPHPDDPLDKLIKAFRGIFALPVTDDNSFFKIAGYHGEPFRGAGWGNTAWWGGYCMHGNVLFPTWHRAYLWRLEKALQSIKGCEDVMLPYWDETDDFSMKNGLPPVFTSKTWPPDSQEHNPLFSYTFQASVTDNLGNPNTGEGFPDADYSKPKSYETVRYPYSGLVGPKDIATTIAHNEKVDQDGQAIPILNANIVDWLTRPITIDGKTTTPIALNYAECLHAPNYTVFSNQTSATQWNEDLKDSPVVITPVVPLETPHNSMHLAVGGFELPGFTSHDQYPGANGDMGENDTAGFDPIFFFHHCFVDKVFWHWQQNGGKVELHDPHYPGTNSVDAQGPTPGVAGGTWLSLKTPLDPFVKSDGTPMTSEDVIDTTALGYTYPKIPPTLKLPAPKPPAPTLRITGANRAQIAGSFYISTWMDEAMLDIHPVLSRWHVSGCANCQTHLNVKTFVSLPQGVTDEKAAGAKFSARVHTRDDPKGEKATSVLPAPRLVGLKGQESSGGGGGTGVLTAVKKVFVGEL